MSKETQAPRVEALKGRNARPSRLRSHLWGLHTYCWKVKAGNLVPTDSGPQEDCGPRTPASLSLTELTFVSAACVSEQSRTTHEGQSSGKGRFGLETATPP